jgi:hypothetical protein
VDVGLGCESGYDEVSYGVTLYGRHIIELQSLGEHIVTKKLSRVGNSFVDMVQVYYLRSTTCSLFSFGRKLPTCINLPTFC